MYLQNNLQYFPQTDRFLQSTCNKLEKSLPLIPSLCIHVGYKCNLNCSYCSSKNCVEVADSIGIEKVLSFLECYQVKRVVLSGGEPFLYPQKLQSWLPELKKKGLTIIVATNGSIREHLDQLAQYIDWVDVSLPATTPTLYQEIRETDLFDDVLLFIRKAHENNIGIRISYTINQKNINDIANLPSLVKSINVKNVRISHTYGTNEELIWQQIHATQIKKSFRDIYGEDFQLYTPLSPRKLIAYQRGYPILTPSGDIFLFNTNRENHVCHIDEAFSLSNIEKFIEISKQQKIL